MLLALEGHGSFSAVIVVLVDGGGVLRHLGGKMYWEVICKRWQWAVHQSAVSQMSSHQYLPFGRPQQR